MSKRYEGVPALEDYGLDLKTLELMYRDWAERGLPKSAVERRYIGTAHHHGKLFSRLVREYLGHETEKEHPLRARIGELEAELERLRGLLKTHGITYEDAVADEPEDEAQEKLFETSSEDDGR